MRHASRTLSAAVPAILLMVATPSAWPYDPAGQDHLGERGPADPQVKCELVELKLELPKPVFECRRNHIRAEVRPPIRNRKILVVPGLENLARKKPVTSSDIDPIIGDLTMVTDGDKKATDDSFVELGLGPQWVQIDLKARCEVHVVVLWHYHQGRRVYKDVIVQVSDDVGFAKDVKTLFNNDHDNSAGLGVGEDWQYIDDHKGEVIQPRKPVKARYIRLYSNGNTTNDFSHYTEVEIYGTLSQ